MQPISHMVQMMLVLDQRTKHAVELTKNASDTMVQSFRQIYVGPYFKPSTEKQT